METSARWQRLAQLLVERRTALRPDRWDDRTQFAADTGLSYRSLSDLERGRRGNYKPAWLAKVEAAYRLAPGAIRRFVDGLADGLETTDRNPAAESGDPSTPLSAAKARRLDEIPTPQRLTEAEEWVEGVSWWPSRRDPEHIVVYRARWTDPQGRRHEYVTEADPNTPLSVVVDYLERQRKEGILS